MFRGKIVVEAVGSRAMDQGDFAQMLGLFAYSGTGSPNAEHRHPYYFDEATSATSCSTPA
jgi:hypothetical protein